MIRLVVALRAEARPLLTRLGLESISRVSPYPLFRRGDLALVVSGVGSGAADKAVRFLHRHLAGDSHPAWLNVGIGGHRSRPVGQAVLADRIVDGRTGRRWAPPRLIVSPLESATVRTVESVETGFAEDAVYEMEASGFYQAAIRFAALGLVQVLKVISDNRDSGVESISARRVETLIESRLDLIEKVCGKLAARAGEIGRRGPGRDLPLAG